MIEDCKTRNSKRFKILKKLGSGSFSQVFKVEKLENGQIFAMKRVDIKKLSKKDQDNTLNEIRLLASISDPSVIAYREAFIEKSSKMLCIIMEYADNGDLLQLIREKKQLFQFIPEHQIWKIFLQLLQGLKVLHSLNIIHRDMKCANVFLWKDLTAKIGDLNISKVAKRGFLTTQTGTPYYTSPEIYSDRPYNKKSDIWSLGVILYEMICLRPPFVAGTFKELKRKVIIGRYPQIPDSYSDELFLIVRKMLDQNPENRPSSKSLLKHPIIIKKLQIFKNEYEQSQKVIDEDNSPLSSKGSVILLKNRKSKKREILDFGMAKTKKTKRSNSLIDTIKFDSKKQNYLENLNAVMPAPNYELTDITPSWEQSLSNINKRRKSSDDMMSFIDDKLKIKGAHKRIDSYSRSKEKQRHNMKIIKKFQRIKDSKYDKRSQRQVNKRSQKSSFSSLAAKNQDYPLPKQRHYMNINSSRHNHKNQRSITPLIDNSRSQNRSIEQDEKRESSLFFEKRNKSGIPRVGGLSKKLKKKSKIHHISLLNINSKHSKSRNKLSDQSINRQKKSFQVYKPLPKCKIKKIPILNLKDHKLMKKIKASQIISKINSSRNSSERSVIYMKNISKEKFNNKKISLISKNPKSNSRESLVNKRGRNYHNRSYEPYHGKNKIPSNSYEIHPSNSTTPKLKSRNRNLRLGIIPNKLRRGISKERIEYPPTLSSRNGTPFKGRPSSKKGRERVNKDKKLQKRATSRQKLSTRGHLPSHRQRPVQPACRTSRRMIRSKNNSNQRSTLGLLAARTSKILKGGIINASGGKINNK